MGYMTGLPRLIFQLGLISFFTDFSSELIFPLLPVFLASLPGGGPLALGIIEGVAESTAAFLKVASGIWTDRTRKRTPFVKAGYAMASIVRPLIGFAASPVLVLVCRFIDRVGKGLRGAPRDALIADAVPAGQRGKAYGLQRIMDHAGAVTGPLVASLLMTAAGWPVRQVILFAAVPSLVVLVLVAILREPVRSGIESAPAASPDRGVIPRAPGFRLLMIGVFLFTLGNSTDAFLLLALTEAGVPAALVVLLWSGHHVVKIAGAWIGGSHVDRLGPRILMMAGLALYAAMYGAFGVVRDPMMLSVLFLIYGLSIGVLEPAERTWIASLAVASSRGAAFGVFHAVTGIGMLPASVVFGLLWSRFGAGAAFLSGAACALAAVVVIARIPTVSPRAE